MKNIVLVLTAALIGFAAYGAQETLTDQDATKVGLQSAIPKINANFDEVYGGTALTGNLNVPTNLTVGGTVGASGNGAIGGNLVVTGTVTAATVAAGASGGSGGIFIVRRNDGGTTNVLEATGAAAGAGPGVRIRGWFRQQDALSGYLYADAEGKVTNSLNGAALTGITATVTMQTTTGYDVTGAAITNALGETVAIVTNVTVSIN
jgi:hypothetical protein